MSRLVDIEPYEDCRIVLNEEDEGVRCRDLPTVNAAEVAHVRRKKVAPKKSESRDVIPSCGKCGGIMDLWQGDLNYCPNCGVEIDWGDEG